jgi:hypothetical protein
MTYLRRSMAAAGLLLAAATGVTASDDADVAFWTSVRDSKSAAELRAYLDKFPNGTFSELARLRLKTLDKGGPAKPEPVSAAASKTAPLAKPAPRVAAPAPKAEPPASTGAPAQPPIAVRTLNAAPVVVERAPPPANAAAALADSITPDGSAARPAASPVTTGATPPLSRDMAAPAVIREIYERLYELNYTVGPATTVPTEALKSGIKAWQDRVQRPVTGEMTESDLALLRTAKPSTTWGAIAYFSGGANSAVWKKATRREAETAALEGCAKNGGKGCAVIAAVGSSCGSVAHYRSRDGDKDHIGSYAAVRPRLGEAIDSAMSDCRSNAKSPDRCATRNFFCADGSHKSN